MKHPILSSREMEVLALLKIGKSDKEIAVLLEISVRAAQYTVSRLLAKFHVNSRAAFRLNIKALNSKEDEGD